MKTFMNYIVENQSKKDSSMEFFDTRLSGAKKISTQAKDKGGLSLLTHYHFAAKIKEYKAIEEAIEAGKSEEFFQTKYRKLLEQLKNLNITQKQFQALSGELEVWGEAIVQLFPRRASWRK